MRRATLFATVALLLPALAGCQSTQDESAEREAEGAKALNAKGLEIGAGEVAGRLEVVDTRVLFDENGGAVVARVRNTGQRDLVKVPIAIDVRNARGKSVFKNNFPGLEQNLVSIPVLRAGETVEWVNDQVFAVTPPESVRVRLAEGEELPGELPEIEVTDPTLQNDPVSGVEVTGKVINHSGEEQRKVILFAVARKGGRIVAAGRGQIPRLKEEESKPATYHIFFIGDPRGAEISVHGFPTQFD